MEPCNGREWTAWELRRRPSGLRRAEPLLTWLGNVELVQRLMDEQLHTDWPVVLDAVAQATRLANIKVA